MHVLDVLFFIKKIHYYRAHVAICFFIRSYDCFKFLNLKKKYTSISGDGVYTLCWENVVRTRNKIIKCGKK